MYEHCGLAIKVALLFVYT